MSTRSEQNAKQIIRSIEPTYFSDNPYRFDVDQKRFPIFSDKNIAFVNGLVNNDSNYTWIDPGEISKIYSKAATGDEGSIRDAVYFTDKMNSTHLAAVTVKEKQTGLMGCLEWNQFNGPIKCLEEKFKLPRGEDVKLPRGKDEVELKGGTKLTVAFLEERYAGNNKLQMALQSKDVIERARLVADIARATTNMTDRLLPETIKREHVWNYNRSNFSFATKFCHHGCRNLNKQEVDGASNICKSDNFCIYDTVVGAMLPYYADAYVDEGTLNNWCDKYNRTKDGESRCGAYASRYAWINGTINKKLIFTPEGIGEDADADVARGYLGYFELYSLVLEGINKWRRERIGDEGSNNAAVSDIGFHEVDLMIWYYFKGSRLVHAQNRMNKLFKENGEKE